MGVLGLCMVQMPEFGGFWAKPRCPKMAPILQFSGSNISRGSHRSSLASLWRAYPNKLTPTARCHAHLKLGPWPRHANIGLRRIRQQVPDCCGPVAACCVARTAGTAKYWLAFYTRWERLFLDLSRYVPFLPFLLPWLVHWPVSVCLSDTLVYSNEASTTPPSPPAPETHLALLPRGAPHIGTDVDTARLPRPHSLTWRHIALLFEVDMRLDDKSKLRPLPDNAVDRAPYCLHRTDGCSPAVRDVKAGTGAEGGVVRRRREDGTGRGSTRSGRPLWREAETGDRSGSGVAKGISTRQRARGLYGDVADAYHGRVARLAALDPSCARRALGNQALAVHRFHLRPPLKAATRPQRQRTSMPAKTAGPYLNGNTHLDRALLQLLLHVGASPVTAAAGATESRSTVP
jgi:hypothetical protein